ncbi:MAG TPA: SEC-C metal-binding domain-containing protein, partial [Streptosporangiaceae bacterium]|nr:SEC-C metal-binding domain-containing protein [Streptosporangiaceae bacterium]
LDRRWREHLYEMDYLREGVSLRGYGQRDPLIEYQREGYDMFTAMMDGIKEDTVGSLFNLQVQVQQNPIMAEDGADAVPAGPMINLTQSAPSVPGQPLVAQPGAAPPVAAASVSAPAGADPAAAQPRHAAKPAARQPTRAAAQTAGTSDANLPAGLAKGLARPQRAGSLSYSAPNEDATGTATHSTGSAAGSDSYANVGRNAPCPCGSGKKFKQCHGDPRNR